MPRRIRKIGDIDVAKFLTESQHNKIARMMSGYVAWANFAYSYEEAHIIAARSMEDYDQILMESKSARDFIKSMNELY